MTVQPFFSILCFYSKETISFCVIYAILIDELKIKPCRLCSRIRGMESEWVLKVIYNLISYWVFDEQNWRCGINGTLKYQSVRQDIICLACNSLHNLGGQKWSWYYLRHLQQVHRNKNFCRMYCLGVMLDIARSKLHVWIKIVCSIDVPHSGCNFQESNRLIGLISSV